MRCTSHWVLGSLACLHRGRSAPFTAKTRHHRNETDALLFANNLSWTLPVSPERLQPFHALAVLARSCNYTTQPSISRPFLHFHPSPHGVQQSYLFLSISHDPLANCMPSSSSLHAEVAPAMQSGSVAPQVTGGLLPNQVAMQRLLVPWPGSQSPARSLLMQQLPMGKYVL